MQAQVGAVTRNGKGCWMVVVVVAADAPVAILPPPSTEWFVFNTTKESDANCDNGTGDAAACCMVRYNLYYYGTRAVESISLGNDMEYCRVNSMHQFIHIYPNGDVQFVTSMIQ